MDDLQASMNKLNDWMSILLTIPDVLASQFLFQFLCSDANKSPGHFEAMYPMDIKKSWSSTGGDLEMDLLFDANEKILSASYSYSSAEGHSHQEKELNALADGGTGKVGILYQETKEHTRISLESFTVIKSVGKGSFGHVFLSRFKQTGKLFALKVLSKEYIKSEQQVEHTLSEREVLTKVRHPNIVSLVMAFQTKDKLFFVLDYCAGGELFYQLSKTGRFSEDKARFYAAQVILALAHVHSFGFVYR
jgi:Protein kinase domain